MKFIKFLSVIFIVTSVVLSCSKEPTACFKMDKTTAQTGEAISLDGTCSTEAEKYIWMSNGPVSLSAGGTDVPKLNAGFDVEGVYTITLRVENGNKSDEITQTITITP